MLKLSVSQSECVRPYSAFWRDVSRRTDPLDRTSARDAIEMAYGCAGFAKPIKFIWCRSPLAMHLAYSLSGRPETLYFSVKQQILTDVFRSIGTIVDYESNILVASKMEDDHWIRRSVCKALRENHDRIPDSVWSGACDSLWEAGSGTSWDQREFSLSHFQGTWDWCGGAYDACGLGFYCFFRDQGLVEAPKLEGLIATTYSCGWWIPCKSVVFVSCKPSEIDMYHQVLVYEDGLRCTYI